MYENSSAISTAERRLLFPYLYHRSLKHGRDAINDIVGSTANLDPLQGDIQDLIHILEKEVQNGGMDPIAILEGVAECCSIFCRMNWTGPDVPKDNDDVFFQSIPHWFGCPMVEVSELNGTVWDSMKDQLSVGGEGIYPRIRAVPFLWLAWRCVEILCAAEGRAPASLLWWRSRVAFLWASALRASSGFEDADLERDSTREVIPHLIQLKMLPSHFSAEGTRDVVADLPPAVADARAAQQRRLAPVFQRLPQLNGASELTNEEKAGLALEAALRLRSFGRSRASNDVLAAAMRAVNFAFETTGVMGKKRELQVDAVPILTLQILSDDSVTTSPSGVGMVKAIELENIDETTDIHEMPKLDTTDHTTSDTHHMISLLLLAAKATADIDDAAMDDSMSMEKAQVIIDYLIHRVPLQYSDYLVRTVALMCRSRCEWGASSLKRDRAALQLQALVDQYQDSDPRPAVRLQSMYVCPCPSLWDMKKLSANRMMKLGSVISASEAFADLKMWGDAADCLVASGRKHQALELIEEALKKEVTPHLLCALGDVRDRDVDCYNRAWTLSNQRLARAQRSIGHALRQGNDLEGAASAYEQSLAISPLDSNCWFAKGCCELKLQKSEAAVLSFAQAIAVHPDSWEAWSNLGAAHSQQKKWREGRICLQEALKRNRTDWRLWDSVITISYNLKDLDGVIEAVDQMIDSSDVEKLQTSWLSSIAQAVAAATLEQSADNEASLVNVWGHESKWNRRCITLHKKWFKCKAETLTGNHAIAMAIISLGAKDLDLALDQAIAAVRAFKGGVFKSETNRQGFVDALDIALFCVVTARGRQEPTGGGDGEGSFNQKGRELAIAICGVASEECFSPNQREALASKISILRV